MSRQVSALQSNSGTNKHKNSPEGSDTGSNTAGDADSDTHTGAETSPGAAPPCGLHRKGKARKTLLVDDHTLLRESLLMLLDQRLQGHLWREAASLEAALRLLRSEPDIDLVLLDLDLPDSRGLATLHQVRQAAPQVPVVVLSAHDDRASVLAAIDMGAAGFLTKTVDAAQLLLGVQHVLAGGVIVPQKLVHRPGAQTPQPELSERQRDVLRLLVEGKPNKLIARALGLTEATVKTHLQSVYRKLDVESRTQAVVAAAGWQFRL